MCGRYTLTKTLEQLAERFDVDAARVAGGADGRYNIAPTQSIAAVVREEDGRALEMLRWGLIPSWAKDPGIGSRMINARSETAAEKPSYRSAFKKRRCLILADGFYEWQKAGNGKVPHYIRMKDAEPFAFAGLYEDWTGELDGEERTVRSCTILTTGPNGLVSDIHDRMPVIMPEENYEAWLDPDLADVEAISAMIGAYPANEMEAYPVSRRVNNPKNDSPDCIEAAA